MPDRYPSVTIRISEQTEDLLEHLATLQGVSKSRVIKQALYRYLQEHTASDWLD
jgi:predicted transcriptional regulator